MMEITNKESGILNSKDGLKGLLQTDRVYLKKALKFAKYEKRLDKLQEELLKLQQWMTLSGGKAVIIFEGRDAAGKGGAIRRIVEHLNPREYRMVALPKPNEIEKGQWYFQRYINHLPKKGEIVFFDRSWYNRAGVETVMGYCTNEEYEEFLRACPEFEKMLQMIEQQQKEKQKASVVIVPLSSLQLRMWWNPPRQCGMLDS